MFQKFQKNYQTQNLSKTWQHALRKREIAKNNYRAMGDIKKANAFASMVTNFKFQSLTELTLEQVIFSSDALAIPLRHAYLFTK